MEAIKVVVQGALGKMGQTLIGALSGEPATQVVGATELAPPGDHLLLPDGVSQVPFAADLNQILTTCRPDVLVDFTVAKATMPAVRLATERGVNLVIGTTGLSADNISEIEQLATTNRVGAVVAPNFALGAVLMMHLAKICAKYLDSAEIIELHHDKKVDAPSGTALATAREMAAARDKPFQRPKEGDKAQPSRGAKIEDINIHSVRLPGLLAHQEVLFGAPGQTLSLRHDTISRECFMPGVILAVKEVVNRQGLVYGLEALLGL